MAVVTLDGALPKELRQRSESRVAVLKLHTGLPDFARVFLFRASHQFLSHGLFLFTLIVNAKGVAKHGFIMHSSDHSVFILKS